MAHDAKSNPSYIIFKIDKLVFAFDVAYVTHVDALPKLTPFANTRSNTSDYYAGIMDLHGSLLPVINLRALFRQPLQVFNLNDHVIVLNKNGFRQVVVVNEIIAVDKLQREKTLPSDISLPTTDLMETEFGRFGSLIVMILDPEKIHHTLTELKPTPSEREPLTEENLWPSEDHDTMDIFCQRAKELATQEKIVKEEHTFPLLVFNLNEELFGVGPDPIRGFHEATDITPMPSPLESILGVINLRGRVVPLIDIRKLLDMHELKPKKGWKIMEIQYEEQLVGIYVDEIEDLVYAKSSEQRAVPLGIKNTNDDFIKGLVLVEKKVITIIDIVKLLNFIPRPGVNERGEL